jgi:MYXO-CTERM domain-containing protein
LFAEKIPVAFPYSDDDIKAGAATVCQMLMFYRGAFSPGANSPLVGGGDPADGAGNNIGAIGGADDGFASICASGDVGTPNLAMEAFVCPKLPVVTGPDTPGGRGFVCVCEVAAGPTPAGLAPWLGLIAATLLARRRRRRK